MIFIYRNRDIGRQIKQQILFENEKGVASKIQN